MNPSITDIRQLDPEKTYTYADYLTWQFIERVELFWGKIKKMSAAPSTRHQEILGRIFVETSNIYKNGPCQVFIAPFDVRLPDRDKTDERIINVVQPDLCVVCDKEKIDAKGCLGAPDLIVEVLSPASSTRDLKDKLTLYEQAGIPEYWVVDPHDGIVQVFILEDQGSYQNRYPVTAEDVLVSETIPGLRISMKNIFPDVLKEPEQDYRTNVRRL